jgi:glycosyl-4,4'-diaponeurosporenoate acyltransferase
MPLDFAWQTTLVINLISWPTIQWCLAWAFTRMPHAWFHAPRAMEFERNGTFYESSFGIRDWKDRLPDAATWLGGGFAKASLSNAHPEYLARFILETWRGELCHWAALALTPVFFLWNPWWGDLIIVTYAIAANLPCILAQRYNRIRLQRLLLKYCAAPASHASR